MRCFTCDSPPGGRHGDPVFWVRQVFRALMNILKPLCLLRKLRWENLADLFKLCSGWLFPIPSAIPSVCLAGFEGRL